jgi:SPP1 gp7 family putative phage head morphogenesis protein
VDLRLRRLTDKSIEVSRPAYEKIFAYVLKQVEGKNVLESKDFIAAAKIAVNPAPLKDAIFKALLTSNMMGRGDGVISMQNQGFDFGRIKKFAEVGFGWEALDGPFTPEEAIKFFSGKVPMTREEFDALSEQLMSEAFYVTGLEKLNIERDVKALLNDALKNGMDLKDFKFKLNELQVKYATPVYDREGTIGENILDYHAETVFRTNMMSAYNEGRREIYSDPDVAGYFPALEYTAIMDGRTTEICASLDGSIYLADDPVWDTIWPPNHFNCRSTVVTINKYDFNQDMISDKPTVVPAEGFGG